MSLAARIALAPPRRVALVESSLPPLGLLVAALATIARWPEALTVLVSTTVVAFCTFAFVEARRARRGRMTLTVDDRATIDVAGDPRFVDGSARLVESTVVWPGFAMLALSGEDRPGAILHRPVVASELPDRERRALQRFLLWSLRARGGAPTDEGRAR